MTLGRESAHMRIQLAFPQASSPLRIRGRNFGGGVSIQRGKVTFSSWLEAPPQKVSPNSHKRGCSCKLSLHGRRKKGGGGEGIKRKSPFFPSSQSSILLGTRLCLQDIEFFTDSTILRFDLVLALTENTPIGENYGER